ncbi:phenylacetate-CoA ligase [Planomicrobium koreense]|uniref:Phenylacetate-CoA ligase n=1 Tax=Planococcus koreensis TaxID=112331 RepID=A0A7W8FTW0_9BACL|nr:MULTISPECIES: phenylacetate--CoA ligase family protein [Planococcus]MBB5179212.1 phenylacetate-CoA ligase [Planococcus koreensis]MDN3451225.1 phenylacetate--CoA ligase family protein [Planococcus sp. APC 3906]
MRDLPMRIYDNSPIYFQNLFASVEGYRRTKSRYGNIYFKYLKELGKRDYSDAVYEKNYQQQELQKLVKHAFEKSPFYQDFYKGIDISSIKTVDDLKRLPVLEKEMVRENITSMYTIPENSAIVSHTLDSAGIPLKFLFTKEDMQKHMAFLDFFKKQHGVTNLEMKRASFSSNRFIPKRQQKKVFWRDNYSSKQRLYSAYYCNEKNAGFFVENLDGYQPDFIDGLPSALYEVAKYINQHRIILSFHPIAIFSTAETLTPQHRREIEMAFDCPVRNHYASTEGAPFITECPKGRLHYNLSSGIIETTIDKEMIITGFNTYGTPLIRYKTGERIDMAKDGGYCECGSSHPVVHPLQDRGDDYLQSKSKGKFTALYMSMASSRFSDSIRKIQFIQNSPDVIDVMIEAAESYTNAMTESIHEEMVYIFGSDMRFNMRIVEEIPVQPNSKFRLVINNLNG